MPQGRINAGKPAERQTMTLKEVEAELARVSKELTKIIYPETQYRPDQKEMMASVISANKNTAEILEAGGQRRDTTNSAAEFRPEAFLCTRVHAACTTDNPTGVQTLRIECV